MTCMVLTVNVERLTMSKPEDAVIVAVEVTHQGKVYSPQIVDHSFENIQAIAGFAAGAVNNNLSPVTLAAPCL